MLKKRWIAIWMALIMLFSCFPVQVFAAGASITSERAVDISKTNATFKAVLNNPTGIQPTEVGIYFGETQGSMRPAAKDTYVYNQASLDFWYNANADMGITLKPATTYWYRFYAIINGQTVWGSFKSMQTAGQVVQQAQPQAKPQASFGNERVNDKTETNGTFYGVLYNPTGIQPSEVGCYIGKSADSMKLLGRDTYVYNRSSLEVWYNANAEGVRLEPGTKYYYQFYAVIGGQKVMGDRKSVTTNGAAAGVHTHDWKTVVEKAHPHKSIRSCACGVSEVVKSSNYVSSCTTCNPPAAVKKVVFQNGTYEISNNASGKFLNAYGSGSGWKVVTIAGDGSAEQRFTLNGSNGNYTIQTQGYGGRGLYLNGTTLLTGQTGQFCFVNRGSGYTISPANDPSKVLTQTNTAIYGGDHVVTLQSYTGAANQLWTLGLKATEFVVPTAPVVAKASFSELGATNVTQTGAVLRAVLNNPTGIQPAEVGCYIGESKTGLQMGARDTTVYNQNSLSVWYDVNKDMGKALKAGSTYYYQFYAVINGTKISSNVVSFKTAEAPFVKVTEQVMDKVVVETVRPVDNKVLSQIARDLEDYTKALAKIAVDEITPVELQAYLAGKDRDLIGLVKLVAGEASETICAPIILTYDVMEVSSKYFWNFGDALGQFVVVMKDIAKDLQKEGNAHLLLCANKNNEMFLLGLKHRGTNTPEPNGIKEQQKVLDDSADRICKAIKDFYSPWYIGSVFPNTKRELKNLESNLRKLQKELDLYETYCIARYGG